MARELELLLYEFEKHGNCLRTSELRKIAGQYQRALNSLRKRGYQVSFGTKTEIKGEYEYRILRYPKEQDSIYRQVKKAASSRNERGPVSQASTQPTPALGGFLFNQDQHGDLI